MGVVLHSLINTRLTVVQGTKAHLLKSNCDFIGL